MPTDYMVTQLSVSASEKRSFRQYENDERSVHLVATLAPGADVNAVAQRLAQDAKAALQATWNPDERPRAIPDPNVERKRASQQELARIRDTATKVRKAGIPVEDIKAPTYADEVAAVEAELARRLDQGVLKPAAARSV